MSRMTDKVKFQPKGPYNRKEDCIMDGCLNRSTIEAVPREPYDSSKFVAVTVRCCEDDKCKELAATLVLDWIGNK